MSGLKDFTGMNQSARNILLSGLLIRPIITYTTTTSIRIYNFRMHHAGTTEQIVSLDSGVGTSVIYSPSISGTDWFYIYIDDSAIVANSGSPYITEDQLTSSSTEPSWSASKHGWYNGEDRCIWAVYSESGAIKDWDNYAMGNIVIWRDYHNTLSPADIDTTWTDVTLCAPSFTRHVLGTIYGDPTGQTAGAWTMWRPNGSSDVGYYGAHIDEDDRKCWHNNAQIFLTDGSQKIEVQHSVSGTGRLMVYTDGWIRPHGI